MQNTTLQRGNNQPHGPSRVWLGIVAALNMIIFGAFVVDFLRP